MAQLSFFGAREDLEQVIDFLFGETDFRIFELYSEFGEELREFTTFHELDEVLNIGRDEHGNSYAALLSLWSPSVMRRPPITRVRLDPKYCNGHTFRYTLGNSGTIRLYFGGRYRRVITKSYLGHAAQRGAQSKALSKLSNRVSYHISRRLAVAKVPGRPVLAAAYQLYLAGFELKETANHPASYTAVANRA